MTQPPKNNQLAPTNVEFSQYFNRERIIEHLANRRESDRTDAKLEFLEAILPPELYDDLCNDIEERRGAKESRLQSYYKKGSNVKPKHPSAKALPTKAAQQRVLMTFKRQNITDAHLKVLFHQLVTAGWIEGQEPDFLALFSGTSDDFSLVWKGLYGKGTLRGFFRKMLEANAIEVPAGYTLDHILEGHFTDTDGNFLQGLNSSGEKPAAKALDFINQCITLLKTDLLHMDRSSLVEMMGAHVVNDENRSRKR